ncbi:MAG: hypothetical protein IPH35_28220 [Rhodoferax sp.]|nr:hypothetical protein [Rhodoferax sp.]
MRNSNRLTPSEIESLRKETAQDQIRIREILAAQKQMTAQLTNSEVAQPGQVWANPGE